MSDSEQQKMSMDYANSLIRILRSESVFCIGVVRSDPNDEVKSRPLVTSAIAISNHHSPDYIINLLAYVDLLRDSLASELSQKFEIQKDELEAAIIDTKKKLRDDFVANSQRTVHNG